MKTKIKLLFAVSLCLISSVIVAQPVSIQTAVTIAEHHMASVSQSTLKSKSLSVSSFQFTSVKAAVENKDTLYYILNDTINKGFVIVSADQRAWPILGYSTTGSFDEENQPEAFTAWMENRKKEIEHIKENNIQANSAIKERWQNFNLKSSTIETKSVEPLIKTQWDQGCYYNSMCPADPTARNCGRVPVGCTITAMAQIMKYWNYPTKGVGYHSYEHPTYGNLSADFGSTTYQWSQMPNQVSSPNDAVATLMYHCGVSLDAEYGPDASGAWDPRDELVQYFDYSSKSMLVNRDGFTTSEWINLLKSELELGHPIWYMGSGDSIGHSFICDGYQDADYFHFNWGWSGSSDGYFYIGNLNPDRYFFNENQSALLNLVPGNLPDGYNGFFLSLNAVDIATKGGTTSVDVCSSVNWTASSDQSWLSLSTNTGVAGKTTLTFTATENQTGNDRSAIVIISAAGFGTQSITVNQLTKVNVTPGNLYNLMANKASRITQLTLKGTIDARDFKTMRDAMPFLTDVDLSNVTIVEYTGTEGTTIDFRAYPANGIPINAFHIPSCQGQNFIKSIIIPETITTIQSWAFSECKYLTSINIPSSVTDIGTMAFSPCSALLNVDANNPFYSSIDGVLFNKNQTTIIHCPDSKTESYTIPSSVTSIGQYAFQSCKKLTTITIPSSIFTIEDYAFLNCTGLSTVFIPSPVTTIGTEVFLDCSALINVDTINLNYSSIDGVLFNRPQTKLIQFPTSKKGIYTIPSSVISIERSAFTDCKGLMGVIIPPSVISIEYAAFNGCSNLSSIFANLISPVNLNSSAGVFDKINKKNCTLYVPYGSKASFQVASQWKDFANIVEMSGIFISKSSVGLDPNGGTSQIVISSSSNWTATSDQAWLTISPSVGITGCDTITFTASSNPTTAIRTATVILSATGFASQTITVTQYGKVEVTAGNLKTILAEQLATITSLTLTGTIDARDFKTMRDEMPLLTDIDLSGVTITAYSGTDGPGGTWNTYNQANEIPYYAFFEPQKTQQGKIGLKTIILPLSVTCVGKYAFKYCEGLTSIIIPPSVTYIGDYAFQHCTSLANVNIPSSVTLIGMGAFRFFNGLINVDANNNNYSSSDGILFDKTQTELIQCPISKTGDYSIPSTVTSVREYAFEYCSKLTNVTIPTSVTHIGDYTFFTCSSLINITIPSSVSSIGIFTFIYCSGLRTVSIPWSVTSIGDYAFSGCNRLLDLTIPTSVQMIGSGAFSFCSNLSSIHAYSISPIDLNSSIGVFSNIGKYNCTLYVPFGSRADYQVANQWEDFPNIIEMPNQAPVANAGIDQTVNGGKQVALNGTGSTDAEGNSLTYTWTAPAGIILSSATSASPTFTAPKVSSDTVFVFSLVVNDGTVDSPADEVMITVRNINNAPVANAGVDQTVMEGGTVVLDGSASFDPDGTAISYLWSAPAGVTLNKSDLANPTFVVPDVSELTRFSFLLTVSDDQYASQPDTVVITVEKKTGIDDDELISPKQIQVYPNPTNGLLTISMEDYLGQSPLVEVFNSMGQLVLKTESKVDSRNIEMDMSVFSQGIYTLRISVGKKQYQQKIVKK